MSSPEYPRAVTDNLLQDISDDDKKPGLTVEAKQQTWQTFKPQALKRYWIRTLSVILIPSIITAWYGIIWVWLVLGIENDEAAKYRHFSGSLIFYSWFLIGIFGLSWSEYGLAGVEFAMLQTRFWKAPSVAALIQHSDATWSSPSGWFKAIWQRDFSRLWSLLTLLTVLPYVAFPLSGLVFEITDGYISTSEHPWVIGRNQSTWLTTDQPDVVQNAWAIGVSPTIPGYGILYTLPGVDRAEHSALEQVPNTLPLAPSFTDMFLAPQAEVPVSGRTWGLRVRYNCSIVREASELTILGEKPNAMLSEVEEDIDTRKLRVNLRTPSGYAIQVSNSSVGMDRHNLWSYSEIGMSIPDTFTRSYNSDGEMGVPVNFTQSEIFEYVMWQIQFRGYYDNGTIPPFNSTLGPVIEGMGNPFYQSENGTLLGNNTFFRIRQGGNFSIEDPFGTGTSNVDGSVTDLRDYFDTTHLTTWKVPDAELEEMVISVAAPIGVRCVASSDLGEATLDGVTSTFSDFEHVDRDTIPGSGKGDVFGEMAWVTLRSTSFSDFIRSSGLPRVLPHGSGERYQGYINSEALLRSSMLAYGLNAIEIMYEFAFGYEGAWMHANLTASREGSILGQASLVPGTEMGFVVLVLFCLWSGISAALGIIYGFRKRTAPKLDGLTMFQRGADMSDEANADKETKP